MAERATWLGPILAMAQRDLRERSVLRFSLLLDIAFGVLNLVTFSLISRLVTQPDAEQLDGAPTYFAFAAVGIVFILVIQAATVTVSRRIREEQVAGTLETMVSEPISATQLAVGFAAYPLGFALARAAGYLAIAGVLLGLDLSEAEPLGMLLALLLSGAVLIAIGIVLAAVALLIRGAESLSRVAVFALGFLGGAQVPVSLLPEGLQVLSTLLPTTYALEAMRAAITGNDWQQPAAILAGFALVGLPLAMVTFAAAVRQAVRRGTLVRG